MTRYIDARPPAAHLGFYFADRSSQQALLDVVAAMTRRGAEVIGPAVQGVEGDLDEVAVPNATDVVTHEVHGYSDLETLVLTSPRITYQVTLGGGLTHAPATRSKVRALSFYDAALGLRDNHVIALSMDGSGLDHMARKATREKTASKLSDLMTDLATDLNPSYAAFNVERELLNPAELASSDPSVVEDIYLSKSFVGDQAMTRLLPRLSGTLRHQELPQGVLVLDGFLGSTLTTGERDANTAGTSAYVAQLIVSAGNTWARNRI